MLSLLREKGRLSETVLLTLFSFISLCLFLVRYYFTGERYYFFLNWNLFLAFLPWLFSLFLVLKPKLQKVKFVVCFVLIFWIVFFPNAPYILTDLFHLNYNRSMPMWFDLIMILTYAWTGMLFGFLSLFEIENVLFQYVKKSMVIFLSSSFLFLSAFGIYLGRFLRWNSWDLIHDPFSLFMDIVSRFTDPFAHPRTWGFTIIMGIFLNIVYWSFRLLKKV